MRLVLRDRGPDHTLMSCTRDSWTADSSQASGRAPFPSGLSVDVVSIFSLQQRQQQQLRCVRKTTFAGRSPEQQGNWHEGQEYNSSIFHGKEEQTIQDRSQRIGNSDPRRSCSNSRSLLAADVVPRWFQNPNPLAESWSHIRTASQTGVGPHSNSIVTHHSACSAFSSSTMPMLSLATLDSRLRSR